VTRAGGYWCRALPAGDGVSLRINRDVSSKEDRLLVDGTEEIVDDEECSKSSDE
jgi:hypothetical protein